MLIGIIGFNNLEIHQMNIKNAFLNGNLNENIYIEEPEGSKVPGQERKLCKFVKSLYGLKQAPKLWYEKFDNVMLSNGFDINKCVYIKNINTIYVIVCLYIDDMLIFDSNANIIKTNKQMLTSKFDMKDMGVAYVILRMKISKTYDGLILYQCHYNDKILDKFDKNENNIAKTLIDVNLHLSKNIGDAISQVEYP
jgi:hypothetical protein